MTDLTALAELVERLTRPDREVDEALMALTYTRDRRYIGGTCEYCDCPDAPYHKDDVWVDPATDKWVSTHPLPFTASIDAAVALCERVLPGWDCFVRRNALPNCFHYGWVSLRSEDDGSGGYEQAHGANPAIALCLAILRALSTPAPGASE